MKTAPTIIESHGERYVRVADATNYVRMALDFERGAVLDEVWAHADADQVEKSSKRDLRDLHALLEARRTCCPPSPSWSHEAPAPGLWARFLALFTRSPKALRT